jgi:hypothetical protein
MLMVRWTSTSGQLFYVAADRDEVDFNLASIPECFTTELKEPFERGYMTWVHGQELHALIPARISAERCICNANTQSLTCASIRRAVQWNIGRTCRPVCFIRRKQASMIQPPL